MGEPVNIQQGFWLKPSFVFFICYYLKSCIGCHYLLVKYFIQKKNVIIITLLFERGKLRRLLLLPWCRVRCRLCTLLWVLVCNLQCKQHQHLHRLQSDQSCRNGNRMLCNSNSNFRAQFSLNFKFL